MRRLDKRVHDFFTNDTNDIIEGKAKCDPEAKRQYKEAIRIIESMAIKGKFVYKYDDPDTPYYIHAIYIKWIDEDDRGCPPEVKCKPLAEIFDNMTELIVAGTEWQLTRQIYTEAS